MQDDTSRPARSYSNGKPNYWQIPSGRYSYTMDTLRLKDNGKLKYGFRPEEITTKKQKMLELIKNKKTTQMLFLTSVSLLFFYLMIKIKNKK